MPKWSKYNKKYKPEWEKENVFKGWLTSNPDAVANVGDKEARCKVCKVNLRAHHADLEKHATAAHKAKMEAMNKEVQRSILDTGITCLKVNEDSKVTDIKLALHIATHSAIRSIDHLTELLKKLGKGSSLENIRLHRTKCSKLIKNVIAPAILTELVADIIDFGGYSLIVDESTKFLSLCVRYFSKRHNKIATDFLGFLELEQATAQALFDSSVEYLKKIKLPYEILIGVGTDGASNMCGKFHSFYTLFKNLVPGLVLVKCVCHSLHLCCAKAADELPSDLEFLVRESRNWFRDSPLRQILYESLFKAINNGQMPKKLVQLVKTRWLAFEKALCVQLDQWLELKTHFLTMSNNAQDKCYKAQTLHLMYSNKANRLYLLFLRPILKEMNCANLNFQKENVEVTKLFEDLRVLLLTFAQKILKPSHIKVDRDEKFLTQEDFKILLDALQDDSAYLPVDAVDFGAAFTSHLNTISIDSNVLLEVKRRCVRYLSVLCRELTRRLPDNLPLFESLHHFCPDECLNTFSRPFSNLPLSLLGSDADIDLLQMQWDKLPWVEWKQHFENSTIPSDCTEFWKSVMKFTNAGGDYPFKQLATFALRALCLPFSNAAVERSFSVMNAIKTKARNRIHMDMLVAVLRIKLHFTVTKTCCNEFMPSPHMLSLFTSKMYVELNGDGESVEATTSSGAGEIEAMEEGIALFDAVNDEDCD